LYNSNATIFEKIVEPINPTKYELFVLIHNAGSIGNLDHLTADMNDIDEWNKLVQSNFFLASMCPIYIEQKKIIMNWFQYFLFYLQLC